MKKELIIIGIIAILFCVELSGCNSSIEEKSTPEEKILGDWISKTYYNGKYTGGPDFHYTFYSNGTCVVFIIGNESRYWYSYVFTGQQLITTDSGRNKYMREYSFSSDNKQLVLTSEEYPNLTEFLDRQ